MISPDGWPPKRALFSRFYAVIFSFESSNKGELLRGKAVARLAGLVCEDWESLVVIKRCGCKDLSATHCYFCSLSFLGDVCMQGVCVPVCVCALPHRGVCLHMYRQAYSPTSKQMCFYFQLSGNEVEDLPREHQSIQGATHQSLRFTELGTTL